MEENKNNLLKMYRDYINKLADEKSTELFTNGGIEYASELMAVLFKHTEKEARVFCQGFKPDLITTEPYWEALKEYLDNIEKSLKVLVETDKYKNEKPIKLLFDKKFERDGKDGAETISIKVINAEDRQKIFNGESCNFAIFDDDKFRLEYDPENYQAFGSFNDKDTSEELIKMFDDIFENADELKTEEKSESVENACELNG